MRRFTSGLFMALALWISVSVHAGEVNVAVASNFLAPVKEIQQRFTEKFGHTVIISVGSTGQLYAQIKNGAPFDIFLSADKQRPQLLEKEGDAVKDSFFIYAIGKLVLWSKQTALVDNQGKVLKDGKFLHLAIVNPKTGPYGMAAQQVLEKLGLWADLQTANKIVQGESLVQTYQFVVTGNAEMGFIALSQLKEAQDKFTDTSSWLIPQDLYEPLEQGAVLLKKGANNPAAQAFMEFLRSVAGREVIEKFGYSLP